MVYVVPTIKVESRGYFLLAIPCWPLPDEAESLQQKKKDPYEKYEPPRKLRG